MDIKKAMQWFKWRLGNETFKPNVSDLEAFNAIIRFYKAQQSEQFAKNELFAKLYIYLFNSFLKHYGATVFDKIPRMEMHKLLKTPLNVLIQNFTADLNSSEYYQYMEDLGISTDHLAFYSEEKTKGDVSKIDVKKLNPWTYQDVEYRLIEEVNHAINCN